MLGRTPDRLALVDYGPGDTGPWEKTLCVSPLEVKVILDLGFGAHEAGKKYGAQWNAQLHHGTKPPGATEPL
jgi:hypothetical protein